MYPTSATIKFISIPLHGKHEQHQRVRLIAAVLVKNLNMQHIGSAATYNNTKMNAFLLFFFVFSAKRAVKGPDVHLKTLHVQQNIALYFVAVTGVLYAHAKKMVQHYSTMHTKRS